MPELFCVQRRSCGRLEKWAAAAYINIIVTSISFGYYHATECLLVADTESACQSDATERSQVDHQTSYSKVVKAEAKFEMCSIQSLCTLPMTFVACGVGREVERATTGGDLRLDGAVYIIAQVKG